MLRTIIIAAIITPAIALAQPAKDTAAKKAPAMKAVKKAPLFKTPLDSFSAALGMNIGLNIKQQGIGKLNMALLMKAFDDAITGRPVPFSMETSNTVVNTYFANMAQKKAAAAKAAEIKFFETNKKKKGVVQTPSGLQYEVLQEGTGIKPVDTNTVKVLYKGTFLNGEEFDSNLNRQSPFQFNVAGGVIQGWIEAIKMMPVGSKWKLYVPSALGYGDQGNGRIPPNTPLVFELEFLEIAK